MTTVWITKYALTTGIQSGELIKEEDGHCIISSENGLNGWETFHGKDWHYTLDDAKRRAEEMRMRKIVALQKTIENLASENFDIVFPIEPKD